MQIPENADADPVLKPPGSNGKTAPLKGTVVTDAENGKSLTGEMPFRSAALRKPGISDLATIREQTDPVAWLEKNVQVSFPAQSEVLRIAITGDYPADLAALVNAVKDAYIDEVGNGEYKNRVNRLSKLEG